MGSNTKIEWTNASWNPVVGCTKVSSGCLNCYAERMAHRQAHMNPKGRYGEVVAWGPEKQHGKWNGDIYCEESVLDIPLHWKKPRMIFVCSMSDLFHPKVPFEFVIRVFETMFYADWHTYQILTKRPDRMLEFIKYLDEHIYKNYSDAPTWTDKPCGRIWLGVTAENQEQADKRIPILLQIPAAVRFVSIEPMLGAIDIKPYVSIRQQCTAPKGCGYTGPSYEFDSKKKAGAFACPKCRISHSYLITDWLDWVIAGGESGPGARPMHPDWVRGIRDQCVAAGVPFFFKQWGEWLIGKDPIVQNMDTLHFWPKRVEKIKHNEFYDSFFRVGKKKAGRLLDGKLWDEFPKGGV